MLLLKSWQRTEMWRAAGIALLGVGSIVLGEWHEKTPRALHIKRRLTPEEWGDRPWGMDYRSTPEGQARLVNISRFLPEGLYEGLMSELR